MATPPRPTTIYSLLITIILGSLVSPALALEPSEILVVANSKVSEGVALARYYMEQRQIPADNLLLLQTESHESCGRATYDTEIAAPIRDFLQQRPRIRCLTLFYGLPLKINGFRAPGPSHLDNRRRDPMASVDSELSLVKVSNYQLADWLPNPYFQQFQTKETDFSKEQVLMVARLDGPEPSLVQRLIDDSLRTEEEGLSGRAYFDARWTKPAASQEVKGYLLYDKALHLAADVTREILPTVLDEAEPLFSKAPEAALYCGWYSLARYQDAFTWQPGAVAYHIASAECTTLKKPGSQVWCKRLLEEGVTATLGPVGEPYVQAFPPPQLFFKLLVDGDFTLMEAYQLSLPHISWKMVLIGDPLYQPFRARGVVD